MYGYVHVHFCCSFRMSKRCRSDEEDQDPNAKRLRRVYVKFTDIGKSPIALILTFCAREDFLTLASLSHKWRTSSLSTVTVPSINQHFVNQRNWGEYKETILRGSKVLQIPMNGFNLVSMFAPTIEELGVADFHVRSSAVKYNSVGNCVNLRELSLNIKEKGAGLCFMPLLLKMLMRLANFERIIVYDWSKINLLDQLLETTKMVLGKAFLKEVDVDGEDEVNPALHTTKYELKGCNFKVICHQLL